MLSRATRANLALMLIMGMFMVLGISSFRRGFHPDFDSFMGLDLSDIGWYRYADSYNPQDSNLVLKYVDSPPTFRDSAIRFKKNSRFMTLLISRRNNPVECFAHHGLEIESHGEGRISTGGRPFLVQTFLLKSGKSRFACMAWEFKSAPGAEPVDHGVRSRFIQMVWNTILTAYAGTKTITARILIDMPPQARGAVESRKAAIAGFSGPALANGGDGSQYDNMENQNLPVGEEVWKSLESLLKGVHGILTRVLNRGAAKG